MSLNRCEQAVFDYWERQPDERRHWQLKVADQTRDGVPAGLARALEREMWEYLLERSPHVPSLRELRVERTQRVSLLNLAEHMIRLWGPPPKARRAPPPG